MGIPKDQIPDHILRLINPEDRKLTNMPKAFTEIVTSSMGTVKLYDLPNQKAPKAHGAKYSLPVVLAWFEECGLPKPVPEYRFDPERKWRFDFAWPDASIGKWGSENCELRPLALEVNGGIFSAGAHVRGAALMREYEKLNRAAVLGWRILFVTPDQLCLTSTADMIRQALDL